MPSHEIMILWAVIILTANTIKGLRLPFFFCNMFGLLRQLRVIAFHSQHFPDLRNVVRCEPCLVKRFQIAENHLNLSLTKCSDIAQQFVSSVIITGVETCIGENLIDNNIVRLQPVCGVCSIKGFCRVLFMNQILIGKPGEILRAVIVLHPVKE